MDLFSRKPIGWALSFSPNSQLIGDALKVAFESRGEPKGVMFHSDQGCLLYQSTVQAILVALSNQTKHDRRATIFAKACFGHPSPRVRSPWLAAMDNSNSKLEFNFISAGHIF